MTEIGPTCRACRRPYPSNAHTGRRLCGRCYDRHHRHGTLADYPTRVRLRADLIADYLTLRADGLARTWIAHRLGMTRGALDRALQRAARAGDTRIDYRPRRRSAA